MAVGENQIIEFKHDFDSFAKELEDLTGKQFVSIFKRSMTRALKAGSNESRRLISTKLRKPKKYSSFKKYFDDESWISPIKGSLDQFTGSITYGKKRHGIAQYVTDAKLESHREKLSKRGFKKGGRKIAPLAAHIIPGKKTILRKAFAGKKAGKGAFQVFQRKHKNERLPLDRPTAPSLASTMRANKVFEERTKAVIKRRYFVEFRRDFKHRTNQALKRASR